MLWIRYRNVILGGLIAGIGGAYLTIGSVGSFIPDISSGFGYIALAALIFGRWTPLGALAAALLFGFCEEMALVLPTVNPVLPAADHEHGTVRGHDHRRGRPRRQGPATQGRRPAVRQGVTAEPCPPATLATIRMRWLDLTGEGATLAIDWPALRAAAQTAARAPTRRTPAAGRSRRPGAGGAGTEAAERDRSSGCNVENASYGLTLCAECGLVSALHASGGGTLVAVSVVAGDGAPLVPCGRCRQLLLEAGGPGLLLDAEGGPQRARRRCCRRPSPALISPPGATPVADPARSALPAAIDV